MSRTLRHLVDNDRPVPEELPPALARWLEQTAELPAWVDRDRFERGCRLVVEHGPQVCVVLATASLVYCGSRTRPDAVSPTRRTASWSSERSRRRGARRPTCAR